MAPPNDTDLDIPALVRKCQRLEEENSQLRTALEAGQNAISNPGDNAAWFAWGQAWAKVEGLVKNGGKHHPLEKF